MIKALVNSPAHALCGSLPILNPPRRCKVGGLGTVEAMVKTCVVTIWERDHDLSRFLSNLKMFINCD